MRTAEEILLSISTEKYEIEISMEHAIEAINIARKETIIECAEVAKSEWMRHGTLMGHAVDKQSILSLISDLQ